MVREMTPSPDETPQQTAPEGYISREELEQILAERDRKHAETMETFRARLPIAMVPAHSAGPGINNHQASWSKAEQEAAQRGETLDHWTVTD